MGAGQKGDRTKGSRTKRGTEGAGQTGTGQSRAGPRALQVFHELRVLITVHITAPLELNHSHTFSRLRETQKVLTQKSWES